MRKSFRRHSRKYSKKKKIDGRTNKCSRRRRLNKLFSVKHSYPSYIHRSPSYLHRSPSYDLVPSFIRKPLSYISSYFNKSPSYFKPRRTSYKLPSYYKPRRTSYKKSPKSPLKQLMNGDDFIDIIKPNFDSSNPYDVLGVPRTASKKEARAAYLKLVKKYHPDKGGSARDFIKIQNAWNKIH